MDFSSILKQEILKKRSEISLKENRAIEPEQAEEQDLPKDVHVNEASVPVAASSHPVKNDELEEDTTEKDRIDMVRDIIERESKLPVNITIREIKSLEDTKDVDNSNTLSMKCNLYIHQLLKEWETSNYQGELLEETKMSLFPLLIQLRKLTIEREILISLSSIFFHLQNDKGKVENALNLYLKLSIGNVAWPIGVSNVGIHSRSAQFKISRFGNTDVANIMINETVRLWITSIKRLITFKEWEFNASK
ncbi:hypothetical protein KAFR_0F03260 [Kazachstania africana CBS 2517]|uniref:Pre-mRNA-splicing factor 18 n=1 Tax=Kazachstania africana (strain ATCC 22294 / BCRC 22015 / CBS 2517 / CECT 1963 / NBRC 1671 / NRRL Y-8276) TaxID=1071382 RepID=H2AX22_KAZAF|nr:hypothetical protein KAFR_0F03260 [Kazachstania africana CBS 2517]CCF58922.1 hypothetical protein KAFR_0F03260 [Kazachstania africana CBS 2517]